MLAGSIAAAALPSPVVTPAPHSPAQAAMGSSPARLEDGHGLGLGLLTSGSAMFAVGYLCATGLAADQMDEVPKRERNRYRPSFGPVVGPWITASRLPKGGAGWALVGVMQLVGLGLAAAGGGLMAVHRERSSYNGQGPSAAPDRGGGLIAAGSLFFVPTYLTTAVAFGVIRPRSSESRAYWNRMMVPIVGPWLAIPKSSKHLSGWTAAVSGTAQLAGSVMLVVGSVRLANSRRAPARQPVMVYPSLTPLGPQIRGRF